MLDSEEGLSYNAREAAITGSTVSDGGRSVEWRDGDDEDSTITSSQSQDSVLLADSNVLLVESNVLPTTNVAGMDGSITIVEHPPDYKPPHEPSSSKLHNVPSALMLEVPTEMHPVNYERNATIPEFTWKRKLVDTYKPLKEFKVFNFKTPA